MDPVATLELALEGDFYAKQDYNRWVHNGGYKVKAKAWIDSNTQPQLIEIDYLGPELVRGICGLVFENKHYVKYDKIVKGSAR